jgi:hypothetical protein
VKVGIGNPSSIRKMRAPQVIETAGSIHPANGIKKNYTAAGFKAWVFPDDQCPN